MIGAISAWNHISISSLSRDDGGDQIEMQPVLLRLGHIGLQLHILPVVLFVQ